MANTGTETKKTTVDRPNKVMLRRTLILLAVCGIVAFIILAGRLGYIMLYQHEYWEERAISQQTRETTVTANRGAIYDRNGNALAVSASAYNVFISPYEINKYGESADYIASELSRILGISYTDVIEKSRDTKSWYKTVATKISSDEADLVREFIKEGPSHDAEGKEQKGLKGVHIENDSKRFYPYGSLACHIVGFVGNENYGLEGLENYYDKYLEGTDGTVVRMQSSNGVEMLYGSYENYNDAIDGATIHSTIDVTVQGIAEKYLHEAIKENYIRDGGMVIVENVKTGEILALANANEYDLNSPWDISDEMREALGLIPDENERRSELATLQLEQWRNRAVSDTYEPGSVFKIITMAVGLEENVISENDNFYCGGKLTADQVPGRKTDLNCWKHAGHGDQTLKQAAQHSCNVAFVNIGFKIGASRFYDYIEAFGLWNKTGIDISGETSKGAWWSRDSFTKPYDKSSLAAASFGQTFTVTPIQMINAVAASVNGGYLMEPYVVSDIVAEDGEVVYHKEPTVVRQVISEETSKTVREILEAVVGEPEGTGKNAYVPGYHVGGKTGTTTKTVIQAETNEKVYMVSFCGVAPCTDPEIAVLVVLDNPAPQSESGIYTSGGVMAAPVVGKIMSEILPYLGIEADYKNGEEEYIDVRTPKVVGDDMRTARSKLAERDLSFTIKGEGNTIVDQLPAAGSEVAVGTKVILFTEEAHVDSEVAVPNLTNLSSAAAMRILNNAGLFMDSAGALPTNDKIKVSKQSVPAGTPVPYGSVISVTLVDNTELGMY